MTDFQPTLPPEVPLSDAELAFLDESPPGLFPENQDSNFGYFIRKIFSDRVQELIGQQDTIWNEKFVATALQFLDEWERVVDLPVDTGVWTPAQRRNLILNRLRKGAFTHAMRQSVVESFITATFGDAPAFDPTGISLSGSGIPLYSSITSLAGTYAIREPHPWVNLLDQTNFEVDLVGASAGTGATIAQTTAQAKFGSHSVLFNHTGTAGSWMNLILRAGTNVPITAGKTYVLSVYQRQGSGTRPIGVGIDFYNSSLANLSSLRSTYISLPAGSWVRQSISGVAPAGAVWAHTFPLVSSSGVAGDYTYVDGVQFEEGSTPTDWSDPAETPYAYEVRILDSLGVDITGLTRELLRITPAGITFTVISTSSP